VSETGGEFTPETQRIRPPVDPQLEAAAAPALTDTPAVSEAPAPDLSTAEPKPTHPHLAHAEPDVGWMGTIQSLVATVVIAVFVITFIVQAFQIPSESMQNTLLIGDYLLVDKEHFGPGGAWNWVIPYQKIKRGDIVVFRYPVNPTQHFVKRVIGAPGDHIRLLNKRLYVNDKLVQEPYVIHSQAAIDPFRDNFPDGDNAAAYINGKWRAQMERLTEEGHLIVPEDCYFVMGDNRDESLDSRYWGFVPRENIIGRPLFIYWSFLQRNPNDVYAEEDAPGDKLTRLRSGIERGWQAMRWKRMFTLIR